MPPKDIETIITEILAGATPAVDSPKPSNADGRRPLYQPNTFTVRPRRRRPPRNPLYTSLRLIILGLVILLVPLLFSVKKLHPPKSMTTGAISPDRTVTAQVVDAQRGQIL